MGLMREIVIFIASMFGLSVRRYPELFASFAKYSEGNKHCFNEIKKMTDDPEIIAYCDKQIGHIDELIEKLKEIHKLEEKF